MDKRIEEIKGILNAATPGPWRWMFNEHCQDIKLVTDHSGMYFVMGFGRYGMHNAQPLFQRFDRYEGPLGERGSRGMVKASELGKWAQDYRHNDGWIDHPDATLIAAAPQIITELLVGMEELAVQTRYSKDAFDTILDESLRREAFCRDLQESLADKDARIAELERERDAAVADLIVLEQCRTCKHESYCEANNSQGCLPYDYQYEWNGPMSGTEEEG